MFETGQVASIADRQKAKLFAGQFRELIDSSWTEESLGSVLSQSFPHGHDGAPINGVSVFAQFDFPSNNDVNRHYANNLIALFCEHISEKFHTLNPLVSDRATSSHSLTTLMNITLHGSGARLAEFSRHHGLPLELLTFFAVYLSRPIRQAVARKASDAGTFREWQLGYCPVCGVWARMGQIGSKEGRMQLWCIGCDHTWSFPRLHCPFCLEGDPAKLGYLKIDERDLYRAYSCDSCRRYLKTIVTSEADSVNFDAEYLSSSAVDVMASFEGYIQDFVGYAAFDMQNNAASQAYRQKAMS